MTTTHKALKVPHDDSKPVEIVEWQNHGENSQQLVFGPLTPGHASRIVGMSICSRDVQCAYDDEGMYNQPFNVNIRAMKLWAHLSGRKVSDFIQPLWGDYVFVGYERENGDTTDVSPMAIAFFAEEGVTIV